MHRLTVGTHGFPQLHGDDVLLELPLVARLYFHSIRPDDLLDLSALEAHLRLPHDLRLRACVAGISSVTFLSSTCSFPSALRARVHFL